MGCGAGTAKAVDAPAEQSAGQASMEMYFQELKKFTDDEMKTLLEIEKLKAKGDAAGIVKKHTEVKANRGAFKVTADRLLIEVFQAGDASGDGFLEKEESAKVFANIVDEQAEYITIMVNEEQRRMLATELGMAKKVFDKYDVQDEEAVKKQIEDESKSEAKRSADEIDKGMKAALANYKAQKTGRDKAAFAVLDKSGDGRINKKEFQAAFDTTTDTYEAFFTALGLFEAPAPKA